MDMTHILTKTCEKGALFAGVGLLSGALYACGVELLRAHKLKVLDVPPAVAAHKDACKHLKTFFVRNAAQHELRNVALALNAVLCNADTAHTKPLLTALHVAFEEFFRSSQIPMVTVRGFGRAPVPFKLRSAHAALCLLAHQHKPSST